MLTGFKNAVEVDFTLEENKKKIEEAFKQAHAEAGAVYPLIIGGKKVETEKKIASVSPATKEVLGYACSCSKEQADEAIKASYEAFKKWSLTSVEERVRVLRRLAALLIENRFIMDAWNVLESGKNWGEADGELCEQLDFINSYVMHIQNLEKGKELVPTDELTKCVYIPLGVGVAVSPWNFPLSLFGGMIVSAVVTGNTICCKPSSDAPIVAYKFVELCQKAGIPADVVSYIPGSGSEIGDFIVEHPLTRFVNFTGSKAVGCRINEHAAKIADGQRWIKRVVAEMGGKNAIIVDSTADIKKAANGVASSAFTFQGQKCSACSRAIVLADVYDEFVDEVVKCAAELKANQGSGESNAAMGPVINQGAYNSITNYIEIGRKEGKVVFGGTYSDAEGYYIDPTVIRDIKRDARIANEEIFGPVLAVIKVDSFDEALVIVREMTDNLVLDLFEKGLVTSSLTLWIAYDHRYEHEASKGTVKLERESNSSKKIIDAVEDLYLRIADRYTGIRRIEVCANRVVPESYVQYSLFDDPKQTDKERHLQEAVLNVKQRYGKNAIMRGSNLLECSTYRERNEQIGGHRA